MREIKFRAWSNEYKSIYQNFAINALGTKIASNDDWGARSCDWCKITDNDVLMQYTGLKDKNGKEIYEGDITCRH